MMTLQQLPTPKPTKADDYRRFALEASARADASDLDHVRAKHQASAVQWTNLAELEDDRLRNTGARSAPRAAA